MKYAERIIQEQRVKVVRSATVQLVERIMRTHKSSYLSYRYYLVGSRGRRAGISRSAAIILGVKI